MTTMSSRTSLKTRTSLLQFQSTRGRRPRGHGPQQYKDPEDNVLDIDDFTGVYDVREVLNVDDLVLNIEDLVLEVIDVEDDALTSTTRYSMSGTL